MLRAECGAQRLSRDRLTEPPQRRRRGVETSTPWYGPWL